MGVIRRQSILSTISAYFGQALGFFNKLVLFTMFLSPAELGLVNVLANLSVMYSSLASVGFGQVIIRFFPYFKSPEDGGRHNGFLFWVLAVPLIGFVFITGIFIAFYPLLAEQYKNTSPLLLEYLPYVIPLGFFTLYLSLLEAYLRALLKTVAATILRDVYLRLILTLSVVLYVVHLISFKQFVLLYLGLYCFATVILLLYAVKLQVVSLKPRVTKHWLRFRKKMVYYGLFAFASNLSFVAQTNIDSLMLSGKLSKYGDQTDDLVGVYTTLIFLTSMLLIPYRSIMKISSAIVGRLWKEKNLTELGKLYKKTSMINLVLGVGLMMMLWVSRNDLFHYLDPVFGMGEYVLLFIGISRILDMLTGLNGWILVTSGKYRYDLYLNIYLVVITIVSNYFLIPLWGVTGAAVATMLSFTTYNFGRLMVVWYFYKLHPFTAKMLVVVVLMVGTLAVNFLIPQIEPHFLDAIIRVAVCSLLYFTAAYFLKISADLNKFVHMGLEKVGLRQNTD